MTAEQYEKWSRPFRRPAWIVCLKAINQGVTLLMFFAYCGLVIWLAWAGRREVYTIVCVPALFFAALSLLRRWINAPRPYEVLKIEPLIVKNKKGNSMPSRHVASACIISMAFASLFGAWSIPFFVLSALLAFVRVIGGIHFPADAVVGAVLGILFGFILFL